MAKPKMVILILQKLRRQPLLAIQFNGMINFWRETPEYNNEKNDAKNENENNVEVYDYENIFWHGIERRKYK